MNEKNSPLWDIYEVGAALELPQHWVHEQVRAGAFPQPLQLSPLSSRLWRSAAVTDWIACHGDEIEQTKKVIRLRVAPTFERSGGPPLPLQDRDRQVLERIAAVLSTSNLWERRFRQHLLRELAENDIRQSLDRNDGRRGRPLGLDGPRYERRIASRTMEIKRRLALLNPLLASTRKEGEFAVIEHYRTSRSLTDEKAALAWLEELNRRAPARQRKSDSSLRSLSKRMALRHRQARHRTIKCNRC
ncbi:MAG: hypothetical protein H0W40_10700 [Methylibium sp.]|uniref:helix-turn-helix transcriptional regulator n=1 Tax=Methylibium sp. TaxID=2067992 RepID=UPI0017DE66B9|nr:hypothetical protein [Methylibium sp.]MBA3597828.1 hypothetical protein [Methylibium sp.]